MYFLVFWIVFCIGTLVNAIVSVAERRVSLALNFITHKNKVNFFFSFSRFSSSPSLRVFRQGPHFRMLLFSLRFSPLLLAVPPM